MSLEERGGGGCWEKGGRGGGGQDVEYEKRNKKVKTLNK